MKMKFDEHLKKSVRFVIVLLLYYMILFYLTKLTYVAVLWTWNLPDYADKVCHFLSFLFVIATIISYEPKSGNKQRKGNAHT